MCRARSRGRRSPSRRPFARLKFDLDDINPHLDEAERQRLRGILQNARNEGVFTPQTLTRDQISIPGELGGSNWGGSAADPATGILYVRSADQPAIHKLREPRRDGDPVRLRSVAREDRGSGREPRGGSAPTGAGR